MHLSLNVLINYYCFDQLLYDVATFKAINGFVKGLFEEGTFFETAKERENFEQFFIQRQPKTSQTLDPEMVSALFSNYFGSSEKSLKSFTFKGIIDQLFKEERVNPKLSDFYNFLKENSKHFEKTEEEPLERKLNDQFSYSARRNLML